MELVDAFWKDREWLNACRATPSYHFENEDDQREGRARPHVEPFTSVAARDGSWLVIAPDWRRRGDTCTRSTVRSVVKGLGLTQDCCEKRGVTEDTFRGAPFLREVGHAGARRRRAADAEERKRSQNRTCAWPRHPDAERVSLRPSFTSTANGND